MKNSTCAGTGRLVGGSDTVTTAKHCPTVLFDGKSTNNESRIFSAGCGDRIIVYTNDTVAGEVKLNRLFYGCNDMPQSTDDDCAQCLELSEAEPLSQGILASLDIQSSSLTAYQLPVPLTGIYTLIIPDSFVSVVTVELFSGGCK